MGRSQTTVLRVTSVDKNPTYIGAVLDLKQDSLLLKKCKRRPSQYMNKTIEQDYRFMKRKIKPGLGFFFYPTACVLHKAIWNYFLILDNYFLEFA